MTLPAKKKIVTKAVLSEDSERSLHEKIEGKNKLIKFIKDTFDRIRPEASERLADMANAHLDAKKHANEKTKAERENIDADTQIKYSTLELDYQKYNEIKAKVKSIELENEYKEMEIESKKEMLELLKEHGVLCYLENGKIVFVDKDLIKPD